MHTLGVAFLTDEEYRLMFRARFGLLPLNAHRQRANRAARCCAYCRANGTAPIETLTHVFSVCPRYRNIMRMRHDDIAAKLQQLAASAARAVVYNLWWGGRVKVGVAAAAAAVVVEV